MSNQLLQVKVKPGSRQSTLTPPAQDGVWLAQLKSQPIDGKANLELIGLVADHFDCRKSDVSIKSGASSRLKLVCVDA